MKWLRHHTVPVLLLVFITCLFFLRIFFPTISIVATPDYGLSDAWNFSYPSKFFLAKSLSHGQIPLWSSERGMGFPIYAEGQLGTFFLPNLILYAFLPPIIAYNLSICLVFITFSLGTYFLIYILKSSRGVALFGAVSLTFSGIFFPQLPHFTHIQALSLFPWIMIFALYFFRKPSIKFAILLAILGSQQFLCGFPQTVLLTWLLIFGFIFLYRRPILQQISRIFYTLIILLGVVLLSSVQLLPSREFMNQIYPRGGFNQKQATFFSLSPTHLLTFLDPFILGNPKEGTYPNLSENNGNIFWENSGNVGLLSIVFFPLGLIFLLRKKNNLGLFALVILITGVLFSLGKYSPLYFIHSFWPFNLFRVPARFILYISLGITIISCLGLTKLSNTLERTSRSLFLLIIVIVATINSFYYWYSYNMVVPFNKWIKPPPITKNIQQKSIIFSTQTGELYNKFLTEGWDNWAPYLFYNNAIGPNLNVLWNIYSLSSYGGRQIFRFSLIDTLLEKQLDTFATTKDMRDLDVYSLYGISHIITSINLPQGEFNGTNTFSYTKDASISAYTIKEPKPRAYLAQKFVIETNVQKALELISSKLFHSDNSTLLETDLGLIKTSTQGKVTVTKDTNNMLEISVQNDNSFPRLLVIQDTYYPGWKVFVNQKEAAIYPVNIRNRGVVVPRGESQVRFIYMPPSFIYGSIISIISHIIAIGLMCFPFVYAKIRTFLNKV